MLCFVAAVGDIHGDINKAIAAFEMAGVLGQGSQGEVVWIGANTTVVQLGDVLDRGDFEIGVLLLLKPSPPWGRTVIVRQCTSALAFF